MCGNSNLSLILTLTLTLTLTLALALALSLILSLTSHLTSSIDPSPDPKPTRAHSSGVSSLRPPPARWCSKRLAWKHSTGGSRRIDICFTARCLVLHLPAAVA